MKTLESYAQSDYSPENWMILLNIKTVGDTNIDNATSVADVITALNNAEATMAAVHTLLDDAKAAAHASLNAALAGYAQDDYSPENWTILLNSSKIDDTDNAASVADVTMALNNAEAAMAAVNTLLNDAKLAAQASLNAALAVYTQAEYSPDNWTVLNGFKAAGDTAIDAASDIAEVEAAQSAAATGIDGVQTIAQTLAAAKFASLDALAVAFGTYTERDYTVDAWMVLNGFKAAGDTAIDAASDIAEVEAAQSAAATGMDGVQTIARTLAATQSAAHDALAVAFGTYTESDYTVDAWTVLNELKTAGGTAIDAASDIAEVEAAQSAAATGMDGVQTIAQTLAAAKSAAHDALAVAFESYTKSNDTVDDETALTEFKVIGDTEANAVAVIDQIEEPPAGDTPTIAIGAEVVDADTAYDALAASQEIPYVMQ